MNRLEKKCFMATAGTHLLLLAILFFGPAFFAPRPKPDDTQVLDVIPANLIDAAVSSGMKNTTPPQPAPMVPPPQPQPAPPAPQPTVQPAPAPEKIEPVKPVRDTPPKMDLTPVERSAPNQSHTPKINLTPVTRVVPKNSPTPDNSQQNARAIKNTLRSLRHNLSSATTVDMPGNSSAAYANYASVVKSIYEQAWTPPDDTASDDANIKVSVTIASDGTVITARIVAPSGDAGVDATVQKTLERVTFIAPFPEGVTEKERTYIINFNLKAKRMLG